MPASKSEWEEDASDYRIATKEEDLRGYEAIKRHCIKKMCDSNKKAVLSAQKVYQIGRWR